MKLKDSEIINIAGILQSALDKRWALTMERAVTMPYTIGIQVVTLNDVRFCILHDLLLDVQKTLSEKEI